MFIRRLAAPWRAATFVVAVALLASVAPSSPVGATDPRPEQEIVERLERLLNYPRTGRGLPAVTVHLDTRSHAGDWSRHMARQGEISHDPALGSKMSPEAQVWGEVVGRTTSPEDAALVIRNAWFRSEPHRQILLDPRLRYVGAGIAKSGPYIYATARLWG